MQDIRERAFDFACRVIRLHRSISRKAGQAVTAGQLIRCGTAIGANLEEAEAAQSRADFVSKNRIALKEAREAKYWLRLIAHTEMISASRLTPLIAEASEIVAILTAIVKKASKPPSKSSPT